jgi:hypothetical protein
MTDGVTDDVYLAAGQRQDSRVGNDDHESDWERRREREIGGWD